MIAEKVIEAAVDGLVFCERNGSLDDFIDTRLSGTDYRKAAASLLFGYFRNKARIDFYISRLSRKSPDPLTRKVLCAAASQILYQTGLPRYSAVDIAVNFIKNSRERFASGFVNAVLRKICDDEIIRTMDSELPEYAKAGLPEILYAKWRARFTTEQLSELVLALQSEAGFTYRARLGFEQDNCEDERVQLPHLSKFVFYRTACPERVISSEQFRAGKIYIQDPASVLAGEILPQSDFKFILDMCSAPGGKTIMLADLYPDSMITAADRSAGRLKRVGQNIERAGIKNVELLAADALIHPFEHGKYDLVLTDVPCSNTGVMRRRPDAMWKFSREKLDEIVRLQSGIMDKAAEILKPGGCLAYSTCSIEEEENEEQIRSFLERHGSFSFMQSKLLLPCRSNDGGYAAVLRKNKC